MPLADLLSWSRIVLILPLSMAAVARDRDAFVWLLLVAFATDALDGAVARWRGTVSPRGAQLDSRADAALYLTTPFLALRVFPELGDALAGLTLMVVVLLVTPPLLGLWRFGRLPALHLWSSRAAVAAMALGVAVLGLLDQSWALRLGAAVLAVSTIEELIVILLLPRWTPQVPSVVHVLAARTPRPLTTPSPRSNAR
ncbi:MAG: CDP-alcohol phosphatidyltransferase family protein [Gemmatimonadetes bacterium]|nr:CDP-alcohol phosphatidyltransferase family protein [Gemmatimonadota bacterium]